MARGQGRTPARLRLRASASHLVSLPWRQPLGSWSATDAPLVELPLGASRHLVRVVQTGDRRYALKELPLWAAEREHAALVSMERRDVPAVRPAGLVTRDSDGGAVLITEYLSDSVLWRSLLTDMTCSLQFHQARMCEAVAVFLVELHRRGVFWGDCSLLNLVFRRDGQALQPSLVDAETAEVHASLTDGQRRHDLEILRDNLAGGLLDLAAELQRVADLDQLVEETQRIPVRYAELWQALHAQPSIPFLQRQDAVAEVRRLNELGYAVEEVQLSSEDAGRDEVRLRTVVAHRRHHATAFQRLTGLQVGEGQATVLLGDLRSHGSALPGMRDSDIARSWLEHVLHPAVERLCAALPGPRDVMQDYCDLLEVRWLLSERAGGDVGDDVALGLLASGRVPPGAAAELGPVRAWSPVHRPSDHEQRRTG